MSEFIVDYLADNCNLYPSDLRIKSNSSFILPVVSNIESGMFTAEDWSASLSYILQMPLSFETAESAKHYYLKNLAEKMSEKDD